MILDAEDDLDVVGEAADGAEAVELARRSAPDVVLMDIRMPELDGIEAARRVVALDGAARCAFSMCLDAFRTLHREVGFTWWDHREGPGPSDRAPVLLALA